MPESEYQKRRRQKIREWSMSCDDCGERSPLKSKVGSDWLCNDCIKDRVSDSTEESESE